MDIFGRGNQKSQIAWAGSIRCSGTTVGPITFNQRLSCPNSICRWEPMQTNIECPYAVMSVVCVDHMVLRVRVWIAGCVWGVCLMQCILQEHALHEGLSDQPSPRQKTKQAPAAVAWMS